MKNQGSRAAERLTLNRRNLLKLAGASAATLYFPAAHAADSSVVKIGWVGPLSGTGALFGEATDYVRAQLDKLFAGGLTIGGKNYSVEVLLRDSQSSMNTATQATIELMTRDRVNLIVASDGVAAIGGGQMAIVNKVPIISSIMPADAIVGILGGPEGYSNGGNPWSFHFCFSTTDISETYMGMWEPVRESLNDKVAISFVDQAAAQGFANPENGLPVYLANNGYSAVDGGMFKIETDDFSNQLSLFKDNDCQILSGFMFANHFASMWRGAAQTGYKPEIATIAGAFLFPGGIDALGDRGDGLSTEIWWSPKLPYSSSITGETAQQMADDWEATQSRQWTPVLGYTHALWEVAVAALKNTTDPLDPEALRQSAASINMDTIIGKVDFANAAIPGLAQTSLVGGQWRKTSSGPYAYDLVVTYKDPDMQIDLQVEDEFKLLSEL